MVGSAGGIVSCLGSLSGLIGLPTLLRPFVLFLLIVLFVCGSELTVPQLTRASTSAAPVLSDSERNSALADLRARKLTFPISEFDVEKIKGSYDEMRGNVKHLASDILSPRGTEIHAVDDGFIAKLFLSKAGGITIYQFDKTKKYVYFYAHLQGYAPGLKDGDAIKKGQLVGFVGTTGDAPKDTPHLHFEITIAGPEKKWWQTAPIDPYLVFKK